MPVIAPRNARLPLENGVKQSPIGSLFEGASILLINTSVRKCVLKKRARTAMLLDD